jgi:hypothetical protein
MNVHHTTTQTTKRSEQYRPTETLLHGYRLVLARAVWITLVLLILVVFFMGIPQAFKIALSLHAETRAGLEQLGLSANFYAAYIVAVDTITLLAVALFAVLIFCRRPNDWMIMFVGLNRQLCRCHQFTGSITATQLPGFCCAPAQSHDQPFCPAPVTGHAHLFNLALSLMGNRYADQPHAGLRYADRHAGLRLHWQQHHLASDLR